MEALSWAVGGDVARVRCADVRGKGRGLFATCGAGERVLFVPFACGIGAIAEPVRLGRILPKTASLYQRCRPASHSAPSAGRTKCFQDVL